MEQLNEMGNLKDAYDEELEDSPLVAALREHLSKYYSASEHEAPFSSRNLVRSHTYGQEE